MKKFLFYNILISLFISIFVIISNNAMALEIDNEHFYGEAEFYLTENTENSQEIVLALNLNFKDEKYTYAPNYTPFPTHFTIENAEYAVRYVQADESYDPLTKKNLELYKDNIYYFFVLQNHIQDSIILDVSLLLCTKENCSPFSDAIVVDIPSKIANLPLLSESKFSTFFTNSTIITDSNYYTIQKNTSIGSLQNSKTNSTTTSSQNTNLNSLIFPNQTEENFNFIPRAHINSIEVTSLGIALLFGLIAGFILNLMPCVLPVVAIKITSLLQTSHNDKELQNKSIRIHGFYFALGILSLFVVLAFFIGFFDTIWGEIFQNVYFIIILTNLLFIFGLSLSGLFSFPFFNIKSSHSKSPRIQAYTQGFIATIIATPCSGPLLGGVIAFSLTLPPHLLILIFLATGLGMALPYLIMALFPNIVHFIPKPGKWTDLLEKLLAFLFFLTSIYLLSLLPIEEIYNALISLFILAFLLFIYSQFQYKKGAKAVLATIICIYSLAFYLLFVKVDTSKELEWQDYSYQNLTENLSQEAMLITFTANWCPTCKVLEQTVLNYENIYPLVEKYDLKLVKVDLSHKDASKENFLKSLNSSSIPLLAFFPKGVFAYSPIILRDIYTLKQIEEVLEEHF